MTYVEVVLIVLALNVLPAFAPPTWSVLVLFKLQSNLSPVGLVVIGAIGAAVGRYILAVAVRRMRRHVSEHRRQNMEAAQAVLLKSTTRSILGVGLFALSPVPSNQLFEAAGLMNVRLLKFVAAFFVGRLVSYSIFVGGATAAKDTSFGMIVIDTLTSPWGVLLQLLLICGVVFVARFDWLGYLKRQQPVTKEEQHECAEAVERR